jgi:hypothetical protein
MVLWGRLYSVVSGAVHNQIGLAGFLGILRSFVTVLFAFAYLNFFSRLRDVMSRNLFLLSLFITVTFGQAQTLIIPQIADGANWQTTLVLTNTTASATSASMIFFQEVAGGGGATQSWTPTFLEVNSTQNLALPAGGTLFLHTPGTALGLTVGWAQLQPNPAVVASGSGCYVRCVAQRDSIPGAL